MWNFEARADLEIKTNLPATFHSAGSCYACQQERKKNKWTYPVVDPACYKTHLTGKVVKTAGPVAIDYFLTGPQACSTGGKGAWYYKPGQGLRAEEIMDHRVAALNL